MGIRNSIAGALPSLITAYGLLQARAHAIGIDFDIADFGGVRTYADTVLIMGYRAADYAVAVAHDPSLINTPINTWRPIAPFGQSMHNYGAAFDVKITKTPQGVSSDSALSQLKSIAPDVGLSSDVPNDPPHFELPISLDDAKAQWEAQGNADPTDNPVLRVITPENAVAASSVAVVVGLILALAAARRRRT